MLSPDPFRAMGCMVGYHGASEAGQFPQGLKQGLYREKEPLKSE